ncbi:MAG: EAL domain-containing protein [Granulosicoccus sp.]|nr:EAL domain-containing protein [Granulosicoccus sp.]
MSNPISEEDLRSALANDEFVLVFQPKVSLLSGDVVGAEALVRWQRADGIVINPDEFIPLAERSGVLPEITMRMLDYSVQAIVQLKSRHKGLSLSMNVTLQDLEKGGVSQQISNDLKAGLIEPMDIQIEITESMAMSNFDRVHRDLEALSRMGIRALMDDFGTGYSSIDRLSQLPFSSLKLDKGVVKRMATSRQNLDVVKSSISMARELRMVSIAEGVESEGAYNFLLAQGCEEAQGYWISHPLSLQDFESFLGTNPQFEGSQIGRIHQALLNVLHYRKSLIDAVYCYGLNAETILDSVIDPEVELSARESRFGLWYYGIGQRIAELPAFRELEQPFVALHECGQRFMQALQSGAAADTLHAIIEQTDVYTNQLTASLRKLELDLLRTTIHGSQINTVSASDHWGR